MDTTPWKNKLPIANKIIYDLSASYAEPCNMNQLIQLNQKNNLNIAQYFEHSLNYADDFGSLDLRKSIALLYDSSVQPDDIIVFPGAQIALQTVAHVFADSHMITFAPGYQSNVVGSKIFGGMVTEIILKPSNNWEISIEDVEKAIIPGKTKYILLNQPHNPTGTIISKEIQNKLITIATTHNIVMLCDEVYRFLEYNEQDRLDPIVTLYSKGISCSSFSKVWGCGGISIGWLAVADTDLKQKIKDIQYFGATSVSRASEIQAIMLLNVGDIIATNNLHRIRANYQVLKKFINTNSNLFSWIEPAAGTVAFIHYKGNCNSKIFAEHLIRYGVKIKSAYCFMHDISKHLDYFRIGYGCIDKLTEALSIIKNVAIDLFDKNEI